MATSKRSSSAPKAQPKAQPAEAAAPVTAQDLAAFMGLDNADPKQMEAILAAAHGEAQRFLGEEVPADKQSHTYRQGVIHLAAKFYAAGNSKVEGAGDLPPVCRYFFELVRRELSGSAQ